MNKIYYLLICYSALLSHLFAEPLSLNTSAEAAIMINADTGQILYQKNPHLKLYPASITKIATALYALKLKDLNDPLMITADQDTVGSVTEEAKKRANYSLPSHWLVIDTMHMGIKKGEQLLFKDLMYGMMIASAGDASNMIAKAIGGSVANFMEGVNQLLKEIGCQNTYFNNPHGLHHPEHVTTAFDMALLSKEALKNSSFCQIVKTCKYLRAKTNKQEASFLTQNNRLLKLGEYYYSKAYGVKTGYHYKAGNTFVAAAKDQERRLILVLLNVKERSAIFKEAKKLFEIAFNQEKKEKTIIAAGLQNYTLKLTGAKKLLKTFTKKDCRLSFYPAENPAVTVNLKWHTLKLPIKQGQKVAEITIAIEGQQQIQEIPLFAAETIKATLAHRIYENIVNFSFLKYPFLLILLILTLGGLIYFPFSFKNS